nr:unnamed protein product [Callosobruchus analis]
MPQDWNDILRNIIHFIKVADRCLKEIFDFEPGDLKETYFTLYNRNVPNGWRVGNLSELSKHFDKSKKTKFVTHGWTSDGHMGDCTEIKNAYMEKHDYNVFVYDWYAVGGSCEYLHVLDELEEVGKYYAKFLDYLVDHLGVNPKDIHLIGHSLGAHVSGFAGRHLKNGTKVGRITGLDPAGPGFDDKAQTSGNFLNANDAQFVDAIHTGVMGFGSSRIAAHVDFYPNGGSCQQECSCLLPGTHPVR